MGKAFSYAEFNDQAEHSIRTILKTDNELELFRELFLRVKEIQQQAVIHGRESEIAGVSNPDERYMFYVAGDEENSIKFQTRHKMPYSTDESNNYLNYAVLEAERVLSHPGILRIQKPVKRESEQKSGTARQPVNNAEIQKIAEGNHREWVISDDPFYILLSVNPEEYQDIPVSQDVFSTRAFNCLMRAGVMTIGQLLQCRESDLSKLRQFGRTTMHQVENILYAIVNNLLPIHQELEQQNIESGGDDLGHEYIEDQEPPEMQDSFPDFVQESTETEVCSCLNQEYSTDSQSENGSNWVKTITETIEMIAAGIDPTTGEVVDFEALKKDSAFQNAIGKLKKTYGKRRRGGLYSRFEKEYPNHAIIMKEGYFYSAHNKSAIVLNILLGYRTTSDFFGRVTTGGPDCKKIIAAFRKENISFILVCEGKVASRIDGDDPFAKYGIEEVGDTAGDGESEEGSITNPGREKTGTTNTQLNSFPENLLKSLFREQEKFPSDVEKRVLAILDSETVFPAYYRRDADCIRAYYNDGLTLRDIGDHYGLSHERIRQLINRAKKRMRRKDVRSFLLGETDNDIFSGAGAKPIEQEKPKKSQSITKAPDEPISITDLLQRLSENTKKLYGRKLRHVDITSWLIFKGDLRTAGDADEEYFEPTPQGEHHGIRRGKMVNAIGTKYIGISLDKAAQEYIEKSLKDIIVFLDGNKKA